jgi:prepilin-type N-terminal cleavage/methylation domain-containing protein
MRKTKKNKGFTLIELIIVIAILAILSMTLIPSIFNYTDGAKTSVDLNNASLLNSLTMVYKLNEDITSDDVFEGLTSDAERMQTLITAGLLEEAIEPMQDDYTFAWDIIKQSWIYADRSYNIVLTSQALSNTGSEIFNSFEDFVSVWMSEEGKMPLTSTTNGSLSWSSATYTGTGTTNLFIAKFWTTYYAYVDQAGFDATNTTISDFKVFFERDADGKTIPVVAGVYIQVGGTRTITFANGEVVNNVHYGTYVDPVSKTLVYH